MVSHSGDSHIPVIMIHNTDDPHTPGKTVSHTFSHETGLAKQETCDPSTVIQKFVHNASRKLSLMVSTA